MIKKLSKDALFLLLPLFFASCAYQKQYTQVLKSGTNEEKYAFAETAFEKKDYKKAIEVFEQLSTSYRGRDKGEDLLYQLALAYYHEQDYFMASYYFKLLGRQFPNSSKIEEASFMSALCKTLESPYYKLDQEATVQAIKELQVFINYYPTSEKVKEADRLITAMRLKLAHKSYDLAGMYYKRELYNAAAISYKNFIRDYPESEYREEAMYYMVKSRYNFAKQSISSKQSDRYEKAMEAYDMFCRAYEKSSHRKELDKYYQIAKNKVK